MQATYALSQSVLAVKKPSTIDLLLVFRAAAPNKQGPRRPLNVSLVIDRSASMAGKPIQQALQAARTFVGQLQRGDFVSVVIYDDKADTLVPPQQVVDTQAVLDQMASL